MADLRITQETDLSLTEDLVPVIVHARQYDTGSRVIKCAVYQDAVLYTIPDDAIVNVTGTRPDGNIFQYSSETDSDVVTVSDGKVCIVVTDYMTASAGRVPVDVTLVDGDGNAVGAFSFTLKVGRAALENAELTRASYAGTVASIAENIISCYITDSGYLCIESEDGLSLVFSMDEDGNLTVEFGG